MSRSYRHTAKSSFGTGNKEWKTFYHQKLRAMIRQHLYHAHPDEALALGDRDVCIDRDLRRKMRFDPKEEPEYLRK